MIPIYVPDKSPRSRRASLMFITLGALTAVGLMLLLLLRSTVAATPWILVTVGVLVLAVIPLSLFFVRRTTPDEEMKAKRGVEGLDLYSVIDRLVDDLDDDEAAYLQRRLDEREAKHKDDLTVSIDDLLEQRAHTRDSNGE